MKTNLTIYSDSIQSHAKLGLAHFIKKYGLSISSSDQNADIYLGYHLPENSKSKVQISLYPGIKKDICYLFINNNTIPLFTKPLKIGGEYLEGKIKDGIEEYYCISIVNNRITIGFDILTEIGRNLDGFYDNYYLANDEIGTCLKSIPSVDVLEELLFSIIIRLLPDSIHQYSWPDNHKFALILTHDVDRVYKTYQYLPSILNSVINIKPSTLFYNLKNMLLKRGKYNPYWAFDILFDLENNLGVKSTYFFLNEKGTLNPFSLQSWILYRGIYDIESSPIIEVITKLRNNGFEIGVHGSYNSYNNFDLLLTEKKILESITNSEVKGIRQHYLNYDLSITPKIHNQCGFLYDSSIGFKPNIGIGFRRGTSFPFKIALSDSNDSSLVEIPLLVMDGALDRISNFNDCVKLIDQVEKYHGVLTILWHTHRFNNREYPKMTELYTNIINESRLRGAWIATASDVLKWMK
jgi:peptidoglycan/xylan/chitin deacetylase (PgdA/CDA1 family)